MTSYLSKTQDQLTLTEYGYSYWSGEFFLEHPLIVATRKQSSTTSDFEAFRANLFAQVQSHNPYTKDERIIGDDFINVYQVR